MQDYVCTACSVDFSVKFQIAHSNRMKYFITSHTEVMNSVIASKVRATNKSMDDAIKYIFVVNCNALSSTLV